MNFGDASFGSYTDLDAASDFSSWSGTGGNVVVSSDQAAAVYQNVTKDMPIVIYK